MLLNLDLWGIVSGSTAPPQAAEALVAYNIKRNKALSTIVLAIHPSLLYLIGDPDDPAAVWTKLENHYQKPSWGNQFAIRKKLYSMKMSEATPVAEHVKQVVELFDRLTNVGDPLKEKDRVMILMSTLPSKFDILITALQSNKDGQLGRCSLKE